MVVNDWERTKRTYQFGIFWKLATMRVLETTDLCRSSATAAIMSKVSVDP